MKKHWEIALFGICMLTLTGIIAYQQVKYLELARVCWNLTWNNGELHSKQYSLEGKDLPYINLSKDSILQILPPPVSDYKSYVSRKNRRYERDWRLRYFVQDTTTYIHSDDDSILVNVMQWNIPRTAQYRVYPYTDKPNLYIGFILKDSTWVAADCVQWSDFVKFD